MARPAVYSNIEQFARAHGLNREKLIQAEGELLRVVLTSRDVTEVTLNHYLTQAGTAACVQARWRWGNGREREAHSVSLLGLSTGRQPASRIGAQS